MARTLLFLFRWGVFALACGYLWREWSAGESTAALRWIQDAELLKGGHIAALMLVVLLMLANWGLEAIKWRLIIATAERISVPRAFMATLAGASVSLVTPNRTGEFVGRVMFLRPETRIGASALTLLGNISQVLVTLVVGCVGLAGMQWTALPLPVPAGWGTSAIVFLSVLLSIAGATLFLHPGLLRQVLDLVPLLRRFDHHFGALSEQRSSTLVLVLFLSLLRYAVFVLQFLLLLGLFGTAPSMADGLLAIPVIFLLTTITPTIMLTELGVRAGVAVALLVPLGAAAEDATWATTLLWSINVLLPAVIGSVILLLARIRMKPGAA